MNSLYIQYPDDWKKIPLRKVLQKFDSGDWGDKPEKENEGYIVIRSTDFDELGRIVYDKSVKRIIDEQTINKKHLKEGDILLNKSSGSDKHIGKVIYFKTPLNEKHHFSNFIQRLRTDRKKIINKYLYYFLSSEYGQTLTSRFIQTSSGLKNIDLKGYSKQKIPVPHFVEQRGIVEVLGCVDECIQLTDEVIGATKELKRSLMFDLFAKGINCKELKETKIGRIPTNFDVINLEKVALKEKYSFVDGPFGSDLKVADYVDEGVRIIRLENIGEGKFNDNYRRFISEEKFNDLKKFVTYPGDIIISEMADPIARACIVPNIESKFMLTAKTVRLRVGENYNSKYIMYAINSPIVRKQAISQTMGSTRPMITLTGIKKLKIPIPPISEQNKISNILTSIDNYLEFEKKRKTKYLVIKQGLMQLLLSGKVHIELREDGLHRVGDSRETNN